MLFKLKHYLPKDAFKTVFDINYNKLYEEGKRIILFDIDNTLIPYSKNLPDSGLLDLFKTINEIGFIILFISNNKKKRVSDFSNAIQADFIYSAMKPLKKSYKEALKIVSPFGKNEMIAVGDQLLTDILGANRFGIDAYLVKPIDTLSEKFFTRINRRFERNIMNRIKKHYPEIYDKIKAAYEEV